jgi:hypothetical protein
MLDISIENLWILDSIGDSFCQHFLFLRFESSLTRQALLLAAFENGSLFFKSKLE